MIPGTHVKYGGYSKNSGNSNVADMVRHTRGHKRVEESARRVSDGVPRIIHKTSLFIFSVLYFLPRASMSWRDTLFIWRGPFTRELAQAESSDIKPIHMWRWKGRWIGVDAGGEADAKAPKTADFANTELPKFEGLGNVADVADVEGGFDREYSSNPDIDNRGNSDDDPMNPLKGIGWQLDNGDGLTWFTDENIVIRVEKNLVVAAGRNEFGPFISAGVVSGYRYAFDDEWHGPYKASKHETRDVMLARRYLDAKDARAKWSLNELLSEIKAGWSNAKDHPWNAPAMSSNTMKKSDLKRKR